MKFVALISGGKDSFFNAHHCLNQGHELVALGNLHPETNKDEIDSFMFQTVGHDIIDFYGKCLDVPLYRQVIRGKSSNQNLEYEITPNDEIEDLYKLLSDIKARHPDVEGVSCGAILSHYQRTRVENVCDRLQLTSLTYLWQRNQYDLMQEMCASQLDARIIKVAAIGLGAVHLGQSISQMFPILVKLNNMYDVHICGEGGEFETVVLDSPFFKRKLEIVDQEVVEHSNDDVAYLKLKVQLVDKTSAKVELQVPPLLEMQFQELYESLEEKNGAPYDLTSVQPTSVQPTSVQPTSVQPTSVQPTSVQPTSVQATSVQPTIISTSTKLYVSNLTSSKDSLQEQATDIFDQLRSHLGQLSFNNIQHITLLLANMDDFAKINQVYSEQFTGLYLPPSRVCVQTGIDNSIQLSCIAVKHQGSAKSGVHIRSRSYWAPQNIGPYSQSIVEQTSTYKLATLSGQIPLVPSTMELSKENIRFQSVLSLQHLHRVKSIVNVNHLGSVVCFIKNSDDVQVATDTWSHYVSDIENSSLALKSLVVAQVSEMPKHADIEWSGVSYENIVGMYDDSDDEESQDDSAFEKLIVGFETQASIDIGKGSLKITTLFTNDSKKVSELVDTNDSQCHLQIIASSISVQKLAVQAKFEHLPVLNCFNYQGTIYDYAIILKSESK